MVREERQNLFMVPQGFYLAHSISADMNLGAGVAKEINHRYNMKKRLLIMKEELVGDDMDIDNLVGNCLTVANVFNLITKAKAFTYPTYGSILDALRSMRDEAEANDVKHIALPRIGCGKDRLDWTIVRKLIDEVFENSNIDVLICIQ